MGRVRLRVAAVALVLAAVAGCGDGGGDGDQDAFCDRLDRLTRNDPFLAFGERASAADIESAFGALVDRARELLEVAPDEARAAARDFTESAEALEELLADVDFDGAAIDARAYRDHQLTYAEASARLERYLDAEC